MSQRRLPNRRWRIALITGSVVVLAMTVTGWRFLAAPSTPPEYTEPRPEPRTDGYVSATHSVVIDAPREAVHRWNTEPDRDLGDLIESSDGFPEIVDTETIWGEWNPEGDRSGDRRRVMFSDGHSLAEEVLVDTSERFRYIIWGFTDFRRLAVDHGTAEFLFEDEGERTRITWTYQLRPTTTLVRPFVADFMTTTMSAMMSDTLEAMRSGIEADQDVG